MSGVKTITVPNWLGALRWLALIFGITVNAWALWVMVPEIAKDLFRFGQLPAVSSTAGFLDWLRYVFCLGWLPKEALHIHLSRKLVFAICNLAFLIVLFGFYRQGRRQLALAVGGLVFITLFLLFSPAVGNL